MKKRYPMRKRFGRIKCYLRHPKTKRELTYASNLDVDEYNGELIYHKRLVRVSQRNIPTLWDGRWRKSQRSWKLSRNSQYKLKKADNYRPFDLNVYFFKRNIRS